MKYKVIVDISPNVVKGTNNCHLYVFGYYKTKKEAVRIAFEINATKTLGTAHVERNK